MNNRQQYEEEHISSSLIESMSSLGVEIIQDNAASLPNCMSKTMRSYLLEKFPDLATVEEETRWVSQPKQSIPLVPQRQDSFTKAESFRNLLPMIPQRQDSFTASSCSSASTVSTTATPAPASINRRSLLVRQASTFSLLCRQNSLTRQSSLRFMGTGAGMPRMPRRQDSARFLL